MRLLLDVVLVVLLLAYFALRGAFAIADGDWWNVAVAFTLVRLLLREVATLSDKHLTRPVVRR